MASYKNKKSNRIRTIRDLDVPQGSASIGEDGYKKNCKNVPEMKIAHIPDLPQADIALTLLRRIHKEFYPIAQKRGYKVLSLSEMCCCGDGLDHGTMTTDTITKRRKRRKRKVMPSNVLGYNQSRGSIHTIHLRLRHSRNHGGLMSYEDVAGTMAHELAHCVYGPHNAKFYKLMDEIQEQHAMFMVRGIVADTGGFPVGSEQAYVLGRAGGDKHTKNGKTTAAAAAEVRRQKASRWMPGGPQALGGDKSFRQWLTPGEAAAGAAEARRLQDEKWCMPCNNENEPIDLLESSSDEDEVTQNGRLPDEKRIHEVIDIPDDQELPVRRADTTRQTQGTIHRDIPTANVVGHKKSASIFAAAIDLTCDDDDSKTGPTAILLPNTSWTCSKCTYENDGNNPLILACVMCGSEKSIAASQSLMSKLAQNNQQRRDVASEQLVSKLMRDDAIAQVKKTEVERSTSDFGFNIYGDTKKCSVTMSHLT